MMPMGSRYPWHTRDVATLQAVRGAFVDAVEARRDDPRAGFAPATANASLAAIRGAVQAAFVQGLIGRDDRDRRLAALRRVPVIRPASPPCRPASLPPCSRLAQPIRTGRQGLGMRPCLRPCSGPGSGGPKPPGSRLADYSPEAATLAVQGKGGRNRTAHLNAGARRLPLMHGYRSGARAILTGGFSAPLGRDRRASRCRIAGG